MIPDYKKSFLSPIIIVLSVTVSLAQKDSLFFKNGDVIVGELKSLEKGVLKFSTDYSDDDFKIEWDEVYRLNTSNLLFITIIGGSHYYGWLKSESDTLVDIISRDSSVVVVKRMQIVHILEYEKGFKERFSAKIDLGLGFAKANDLRQITINSKIGYKTDKWNSYITYNTLRSTQKDIDPIKRTESAFVFNYILYKDWYLIISTNYLTNTEQQLNYRWNGQCGIGNYLIRSNVAYWGLKMGINRNREDFMDETPDAQTWEAFFGTELNLFNTGDFSLFTTVLVYPGLSVAGRWRSDASITCKYDLPLDFYIKLDYSMNYDNKPRIESSDLDYVSTIGFGWEW